MLLPLNVRYFFRLLCWTYVIVFALNFLIVGLNFSGYLQSEIGQKVFEKLYVDRESNVPSYFNTILFLIIAAQLFVIYRLEVQRNSAKPFGWALLAIIFGLLSLDENASVHEFFVSFLPKHGIGGHDYFYFAWVIPYGLFTGIFFIYQIRFLRKLDNTTSLGFIFSGFVYVSGAIGVEMLTSKVAYTRGVDNLTYAMLAGVEELLEMGGLLVFIYFILKYLKLNFATFSVNVVKESVSPSSLK